METDLEIAYTFLVKNYVEGFTILHSIYKFRNLTNKWIHNSIFLNSEILTPFLFVDLHYILRIETYLVEVLINLEIL
jgi:hypothetical protein